MALKDENFSQMQRACYDLGIEIIFANSPQGKGRVESTFDTIQDRLIPELRINKIKDVTGANRYLQRIFIPKYWQANNVVVAESSTSEFTPIPDHFNLDDICITKEYRKIRNDHTFSYGNKFYEIKSPLKHSITKQKIEIRKMGNNSFTAYFAGRKLDISEVIEPTKLSTEDLEVQKKLDVLALADELGNVSEASCISGISRDTIYRHKRLVKSGGKEALKRQFTPNHRHKNRPPVDLEKLVIQFSLQNPHLGQAQVAAQLKVNYDAEISPNGVRNVWLRENMNTCVLRVQRSQLQSDIN